MPKPLPSSSFFTRSAFFNVILGMAVELKSAICYKLDPIPRRKKLGLAIASVSINMSSLSDWSSNSRRI